MFKRKEILQFYHIPCVFEMFRSCRTLPNIIKAENELKGFDIIAEDDKQHIRNEIIKVQPIIHAIKTCASIQKLKNESNDPVVEKTVNNRSRKQSKQTSYNSSSISIMFTNADQLTSTKMVELQNRIANEKPFIIAVTEVKIKHGEKRELIEYNIDGFTFYHCSLGLQHGRGIAVYVANSLVKSVVQVYPENAFSEFCLLKIKLRGGDMMLFGCIYRSPTISVTSVENNESLNRLLRHIRSLKYSHVCIVGDFNYKKINWANMTTSESENSTECQFLECVQDCFLYQHVTKATRIRGLNEPSLLDLILTDEVDQVTDVHHLSPLGASDHNVITFKFSCYTVSASDKLRYLYYKANYNKMKKHLESSNWSINYVESVKEKHIDDAWEIFKSKMIQLRDEYVPKQSDGMFSWKNKGHVPINDHLQEKIKKKHSLHSKWIRAHFNDKEKSRLEYVRVRNQVKTLLRKAKRNFEKDISNNAKSQPKKFWSYVRRKLKTRAGIAPLLKDVDDPDSLQFDDAEKARILQEQFCSVFVREPDGEIPVLERRTDVMMPEISITREDVIDEIKSINKDKSCGPDEIDIKMLQELIDYVADPITNLLKKSVDQGTLPNDWREAIVTPVYKKGAKSKAENYRPISLTSIICKVLESIIKKHIVNHFINEKLFADEQHGFMKGRSTTTQLLKFLDKCIQTYASGGVTDVIYLDFAKAFDTVPHKRLIAKLEAYGIHGKILNWIKAFLKGRKQRVRVNGDCSHAADVLSGIPQGSVLGPILFLIFINDLPDAVESDSMLFADDSKIYRVIKSKEDSSKLQNDLNSLLEWTRKWLLKFNQDKCHVLSIGEIENIIHAHYYTMNEYVLDHVFEEKDLGVVIDSQLSFEEHINQKIKKANAMVGLIRRTFTYLEPMFFKKLYIAFVRPHLEYVQSVWSPYLRKYINAIEKIQMRATKYVDGFDQLTYTERLKQLDLPTLVHRRKRGDMIEMFKHATTYDKAVLSPSIVFAERPSRKHDVQLLRREAADGMRGKQRNSFQYRVTATWNDLPRHVVQSSSVAMFKQRLDDHWKDDEGRFTLDRQPYHHARYIE